MKARAVAAALVGALCGCATQPPPITKVVDGRVVTTRSVDADAYEHAARAALYEEEGRWADAAAELGRALITDRDAPELHARLAEALLHLDRVAEAAVAVAASLAIETTVDGLVADAHLRQTRGDPPGAIAPLEQAVKMAHFSDHPTEAEAVYLELAEAQILALRVADARDTLRVLCQSAPHSATARVRLAGVAWALGDVDEAQARVSEAINEEPNQVDALLLSAWLHAAQGQVAGARSRFDEALERSEGSLEIATAYARFLMGLGDTKAARALADELGASDVADETLPARLTLERAVKRPERILKLIDETLAGDADVKRTLALARGQALEDQGKHKEAVAAYLDVPTTSELFAEARLQAAGVLRNDGQFAAAARALGDIKPDPKDDRLDVELAVALATLDEKQGNATRGLAQLDGALGRHPGNARLALARAAIDERRGQWQAALQTSARMFAKDPGSVEALNFWGFVAADHDHDLPLARQRLTTALAMEPGSGSIIDSLGWVAFHAGDTDRAALFLEQAGRLEPDDAEVLAHLGQLYAKRGQTARAIELMTNALDRRPEDILRRRLEADLVRLSARKAPGR